MLQVVLSGVSAVSKLARHFNGTSDMLLSAANIDLTSTNVITVAFRFKLTGSSVNIIRHGQSGNYVWRLYPHALDFFIAGAFDISASLVTPPTANVWHDYLFVIDNSQVGAHGATAVYVDGVLQTVSWGADDGHQDGHVFESNALYVMNDSSTGFAAGSMCDLVIWKADESAHVAAIRDFSTDLTTVDAANLLYYWPFKQVSPETPNAGTINLTVTGTTNDTDP